MAHVNPFDVEEMAYEDGEIMLFEDGEIMLFENYKINTTDMLWYLPIYYNKLSGIWVDLSFAFKSTTNGWDDILDTFRNGFIFHKATAEQLAFLESMLKVPVNEALTLNQRAGRLMAKLSKKSTTRDVILAITKQFYPDENPQIDELGDDYTVTVLFNNMVIIPEDITIYRDTIEYILQADLDFLVALDIAMSAFTHTELADFTHENLNAYWQGVE